MPMYRSGPDDKELEDWHNFLTNNEGERITTLASEGKDDDWRSLKLNLSKLREANAELYERILEDPIQELEKGEFILQKLIEEEGGHFEINLQYTGLGNEHYTDPANISTKDVGRLITFDGFPVGIGQILPWFKKAAWKCKSCKRMTLKDNPKHLKLIEPEICEQEDGGCGALNVKNISQYFKITSKHKLTNFELVPYQGTLLDLRFMVLAEFENSLNGLEKMGSVEPSKTINSIAVGAIARAIYTKVQLLTVTGMVTISDEGNMFELEILGIHKIPTKKFERFEQRYSKDKSADEGD